MNKEMQDTVDKLFHRAMFAESKVLLAKSYKTDVLQLCDIIKWQQAGLEHKRQIDLMDKEKCYKFIQELQALLFKFRMIDYPHPCAGDK